VIDMPINEMDAAALVASHLALAQRHVAAAAPATSSLDVLPPHLSADITRRLDEVAAHVDGLRCWIAAVAVAAV
jgi:hypothetical protein